MSFPALAFRNVGVRHEPDEPPTLTEVSFSVAAGERVALLGLNGSGKTTLLLAAVGLVPHAGEIEIGGVPVARRTLARVREGVGFLFNVPEDQLLFPRVVDDVAFGLVRRGVAPAAAANRAKAVLSALGVGHLDEASLHHLSHGQKQRVALAGALACAPPLLLLDEPSAGLDPPAKWNLAHLLLSEPAAMVVASHDLEFAGKLCTRFLTLESGRIVRDAADPGDTLRAWGGP